MLLRVFKFYFLFLFLRVACMGTCETRGQHCGLPLFFSAVLVLRVALSLNPELTYLARLAGQGSLGICLCLYPPELGLQVHPTTTGLVFFFFLSSSRDLNSGPYALTAKSLSTESSPQTNDC